MIKDWHVFIIGEWEKTKSLVCSILHQYQKEGYQALIEMADKYRGDFLTSNQNIYSSFLGKDILTCGDVHDTILSARQK